MDRMNKKSKSLNNKLYNLLLAMRSFTNASELIDFLIKRLLTSDEEYIADDPLFDAVLESFIITYARPFTDSKPQGKLPQKITNKFDKNRKACHDALMDKRHMYHAHSDGKANTIKIVPAGVKVNECFKSSENTSYVFLKEAWKLNRFRFIESHLRKLTQDILDEIEKLELQAFPNGMPNEMFELKAL